jgi:hypothetical protein
VKSAFTIELCGRLIPQLPHNADATAIADEPFATQCRPVSDVVVAHARTEGVPK